MNEGLSRHQANSVGIFKSFDYCSWDEDEQNQWINKFKWMAQKFNKKTMPSIHIQGFKKQEKMADLNHSFRILDGHHRCLIYAIRVLCKEEQWSDISAVYHTSDIDWPTPSWKGLLDNYDRSTDNP